MPLFLSEGFLALNHQRKLINAILLGCFGSYQALRAKLEQQAKLIEALRGQVTQTGERVTEMTFEQKLAMVIPDFFTAVDNDPKWVAWLDEYDPIIRGPRRSVAEAAYTRQDVQAVADYVGMFKATTAAPAKDDPRRAELVKQSAPKKTVVTRAASSTSGDKVYTLKQIDEMWGKVTPP